MSAILKQIWLFCTGEWPNWLPTVGHTLAKTPSKTQNILPENLLVGGDLFLVCPQSSAWSLTLLSCVLDQIYAWRSWSSCSYPPGQWFSCEHRWIPGFSSSLSLWLVLFCYHGRGSVLPPCLSAQIQAKSMYGLAGIFIAVLFIQSCVGHKGYAIIRVAQTCYGLHMCQAAALLLVPDIILSIWLIHTLFYFHI